MLGRGRQRAHETYRVEGPGPLSSGAGSDESFTSPGGSNALNLAAIAAAAFRLLRTRSSKSGTSPAGVTVALGIDEGGCNTGWVNELYPDESDGSEGCCCGCGGTGTCWLESATRLWYASSPEIGIGGGCTGAGREGGGGGGPCDIATRRR
jgi:hypothetical protein